MKIAFWCSTCIEGGATKQMVLVALLLKYVFRLEVIVSCNYISDFMPEHCCEAYRVDREQCLNNYLYCYGELDYFRKLWEINDRRSQRCDTVFGDILFVPPPDSEDEKMFYYEVPDSSMYLLDVAPKRNAASRLALEEADAVVVFLPQNRIAVQNFFEQYASIIPKAIFIINDFRIDGDYIPRLMVHKYQISKENIGVFPYCADFHQACTEGNIENFLKTNLKCSAQNSNYYFVKNLLFTAGYVKKKRDNFLHEKGVFGA